MAKSRSLSISAIDGIPLVRPGDDVCALLLDALAAAGKALIDDDVLVIAQKIISKAQDCYVRLSDVTPSARARELAVKVDKDPRIVELILSEASEIVRYRQGVLIVEHRLGLVLANAGIDASNVAEGGADDDRVLLLPHDPDGDCTRLRAEILARAGASVSVIISDSVGRAWRNGTVGIAIGAAGLPALLDIRGHGDLFGRPLLSSQIGLADELAAAASLVQGQADEGIPAVLIRGFAVQGEATSAKALIRDAHEDLFR